MSSAIATRTGTRIGALDGWRGLVIVVMALDHANGFIAERKLAPELWAGPFPDYGGDWAAFLTRWVSHLAAPGFFFLMGAGVVLFARSRRAAGWSDSRIGVHLTVRGLLLIALQFLWENPAWTLGSPASDSTYVGVLFALGGCLVIAAWLTRVPSWLLVAVGVSVPILVEATLPSAGWVAHPPWQLMLLWPGFGGGWFSLYPIVPWLGVVLLGMAFGRAADRSTRLAFPLGAAAVVAFVIVRLLDGFGTVRPRQPGVMGFLNVVKYPPSLVFVLLTLGLGLLALSWFAGGGGAARMTTRLLATYGRVPLFFYLIHLYVYAQLGVWLPPTSLPVMYAWWLAGLAVLYPLCRWYGGFKARQPAGSVWRFL